MLDEPRDMRRAWGRGAAGGTKDRLVALGARRLTPPDPPAPPPSLDDCVEYIAEDELVEVTPVSVRMLKNMRFGGKKGGK